MKPGELFSRHLNVWRSTRRFVFVDRLALFERMEIVPAANGAAWVGKVAGDDNSQVILAVSDGVLSGSVSEAGRMFSVRRELDGTYTIAEVNANAIPPDGEPLDPERSCTGGSCATGTVIADIVGCRTIDNLLNALFHRKRGEFSIQSLLQK